MKKYCIFFIQLLAMTRVVCASNFGLLLSCKHQTPAKAYFCNSLHWCKLMFNFLHTTMFEPVFSLQSTSNSITSFWAFSLASMYKQLTGWVFLHVAKSKLLQSFIVWHLFSFIYSKGLSTLSHTYEWVSLDFASCSTHVP